MPSSFIEPTSSSPLADWLAYLGSIHVSAIDMGLERVLPVAQALGITNPNAQVVTVAGTNGKGSTTETVAALAQAAGKKVALYQSPHVFLFNERVSIDGEFASDQALVDAFIKVDAARKACGLSLSFFEATTLAAFLLFTEACCDVWVLEVGLGGRLDVVNIIDADVAVITNIGLDHTDWLGDDINTIGFEKAGILRTSIPCVLASNMPPSVYSQAEKLGVQLIEATKDYVWRLVQNDGEQPPHWLYSTPSSTMKLPLPKLALKNVAAGLAAFLALGIPLALDMLANTIANLSLLGRFDERTWQDRRLIMDAAHNPDGARFFMQQLQARYPNIGSTPIYIVFSMLADKAIGDVLSVLHEALPQARWYIAPLTVKRAAPCSQLESTFNQSGIPKQSWVVYNQIAVAMQQALADSKADERILVLGSFHTLAEVLAVMAR